MVLNSLSLQFTVSITFLRLGLALAAVPILLNSVRAEQTTPYYEVLLVPPVALPSSVSAPQGLPNFFDFWQLDTNSHASSQSWEKLSSPLEPARSKYQSIDFLSQLSSAEESLVAILRQQSLVTEPPSFPAQVYGSSNFTGRLSLSQQSEIDFLKLQSKFDLPDSNEIRTAPYVTRNWNAEQSINVPFPVSLPVAEAMFVFGQMGSNGDAVDNQTTKLTGKTGIGWKWTPQNGYELQLKGGPSVSYSDLYLPTRFKEPSQMSIELQAKMAVIGPLNLQYTGEALPAMNATDHDQLKQDFKLAFGFGTGNQFYLGAKYRWDGPAPTTSWLDRAQLYFGLEFKR